MAEFKDPLEGITAKTNKAELLNILQQLAAKLRGREDERVTRLGEVEQRVRERYRPGSFPALKRMVVASSEDEFRETYDFLDEFDDLLPPTLQRFKHGLATLLKIDSDDKALAVEDKS